MLQEFSDQNKRTYQQDSECNSQQIEIFLDKGLDWRAKLPDKASDKEEPQTSRYDWCQNKHHKINLEQSARDCKEFIRQRGESRGKDNPEIVSIVEILHLKETLHAEYMVIPQPAAP